jgi:hypothetical protein
MPPTMNARSSFDSPIALITPLTFKPPLNMPFNFMKNSLYEKAPDAVNLAPAAMNHHHAEKEVKTIPQSPVAKARQLGSDFFSSWKQSMQFPKPDNAARARQISQELCSPCSAGHSQDVLLLRNVLQQERQQAKTATPPPLVPPPPTASLKYVPSPNKIAQQISQELCKTRSDADCTDLSFTIDNTPPFGTPAKSSVHRFKQIALEPRSPYWAEGELTAPWVSFHASQEMLIKDAVTKKRLMSLIIVPEPPSQEKSSPENFQAILVNKPTTTTRRRNEKTRQSRSVVRSAYEETPYRAPSTGLLSVRVAVTE